MIHYEKDWLDYRQALNIRCSRTLWPVGDYRQQLVGTYVILNMLFLLCLSALIFGLVHDRWSGELLFLVGIFFLGGPCMLVFDYVRCVRLKHRVNRLDEEKTVRRIRR